MKRVSIRSCLRECPSAGIFGGLLFLIFVFLLALPFSRTLQERVLRKFHLANTSAIEWGILQTVPSMYSFRNEAILLSGDMPLKFFSDEDRILFNHYPAQVVTFYSLDRFQPGSEPIIFQFSSSYRGLELISTLQVERADNGV
ncbi:MAG: hypothetical protein AAF558_14925, partial [Verrucomicrobiota bacterium]